MNSEILIGLAGLLTVLAGGFFTAFRLSKK